jgi:Leucine-rich repeat (LRR) protein
VDEEAPLLLEQLSKFPALKQLDVSANPRLRLLPIGMLRIAATLEAFKCDGCSLVLPPQSMFSTSEENPRLIQELLSKGSSVAVLELLAADLKSNTAREIAVLLEFYPALKRLDLSANPELDFVSVSLILKALSGETHHFVFFQARSDASTCFYCFPRSG